MLTLASVRRAIDGLQAEVFVVDNASSDGSADRVRSDAPWVKLIALHENVGFSRANNQAMAVCSGRVVTILNPDTIVPLSFFRQLIEHFDSNPDSGAVGVRMINGRGAYLRESKRGYTDLLTSFFKLTGMWHLAPKSATINAYYVGQCSEGGTCKAPILSGACMSFSHQLMDKVGFFDPQYFMYSEDIDLSWRMDLASNGNNTYRGDLCIIHFKGQSTPRRKEYIGYFYDSMLLFARHYEYPRHNKIVNALTHLGIKAAYSLAVAKCTILRCLERRRTFVQPRKVAFVTRSEVNSSRFRDSLPSDVACDVYSDNLMEIDEELYDAVVFDIDYNLLGSIECMKTKVGQTNFGFYNPDDNQALVFFNNRCHNILKS